MILPIESEWQEIIADSPEQAAQEFHFNLPFWCSGQRWTVWEDNDTKRYEIYFANIEIENHGNLISRIYNCGIWRRGGIKIKHKPYTLEDVSKSIGWGGDPQDLIKKGWDLEEGE